MGDSENAQQPSKKRAALKELSRENPGLDDDEDSSSLETGTFKTATEEVLATRIVRVKRRDPSAPAPSSNPFAGIGLEASKTLSVSNSTSSEGKQETQDDGRSDATKEIIDGGEKDKSEAIKSEGDGGADETKTTIVIENVTRKEIERVPVSDLAGGPSVYPTLSLEFPEPPPGYDTDELVFRQYMVNMMRQLWGLIASAITCTCLRSTQTHRRRRSPVSDLAGGPPVHPPPLEFPEPPPGYDIDDLVYRQYMASMIRQLWSVIASAITCTCRRRSPVPDLAGDPPVHPPPSLEFPEPPLGYDIDELVFREYMDIMMRQLWGVIASAITCNCLCANPTHKHHCSPTPDDDDDADTDAADADDGSEED